MIMLFVAHMAELYIVNIVVQYSQKAVLVIRVLVLLFFPQIVLHFSFST